MKEDKHSGMPCACWMDRLFSLCYDPSERVQPGICALCGYSKKEVWKERPLCYFQYSLKSRLLGLNSMLRNSPVHSTKVGLFKGLP